MESNPGPGSKSQLVTSRLIIHCLQTLDMREWFLVLRGLLRAFPEIPGDWLPHCCLGAPEYKTMLSCTPQLNDIIAQDPQRTCDEMIAAGLIQSVHIREFIRHPTHTDRAKATKLVDFMTDRVKTSPSDFDKFMAILKKGGVKQDRVSVCDQSD